MMAQWGEEILLSDVDEIIVSYEISAEFAFSMWGGPFEIEIEYYWGLER